MFHVTSVLGNMTVFFLKLLITLLHVSLSIARTSLLIALFSSTVFAGVVLYTLSFKYFLHTWPIAGVQYLHVADLLQNRILQIAIQFSVSV